LKQRLTQALARKGFTFDDIGAYLREQDLWRSDAKSAILAKIVKITSEILGMCNISDVISAHFPKIARIGAESLAGG
jgi:hypothetical protein